MPGREPGPAGKKRELGECDGGSSRSVTGVEQGDFIRFGVSTTREAIRLGRVTSRSRISMEAAEVRVV